MTTPSRRPVCRAILRNLDDVLEGKADPETQKALDLHLQNCPRCGEMVRQLRENVDLCRKAKTPCLDRECLEKAIQGAREELVRRGAIPR